jgi:hypothetical protein
VVSNGSGNDSDRDKLVNWIIEKTDCLNVHWQNIIDAEQGGYNPNGSHLYSNEIQRIAKQARLDIRNYRSKLSGFNLSGELGAVKVKCGTFLDNWDGFFYYMDKYSRSENVDDFGAATRSYKAVDGVLSEILALLGLKSTQADQPSIYPQSEQQPVGTIKEKEIIRMKEVIVKVKCPYCQSLYDETLNKCPFCGGNR